MEFGWRSLFPGPAEEASSPGLPEIGSGRGGCSCHQNPIEEPVLTSTYLAPPWKSCPPQGAQNQGFPPFLVHLRSSSRGPTPDSHAPTIPDSIIPYLLFLSQLLSSVLSLPSSSWCYPFSVPSAMAWLLKLGLPCSSLLDLLYVTSSLRGAPHPDHFGCFSFLTSL